MVYSPFEFGGNPLFTIVPIIFGICMIAIFGTFFFYAIQRGKQYKRNNDSPVLTVDASVVAKRTNVSHHNTGTNDTYQMSSSSSYFVTFEVESGDRLELEVSGSEYGMLAEKDGGKLTFQGTRYLGFERFRI